MQPEMKNAGSCNKYRVIKTLGQGATAKVKLALSPQNRQVAIKRFKENLLQNDDIKNEIEVMGLLQQHPNLVELIEMMEKACCINQSGESYQADCMVLQLVSQGELFDYIAMGGRFCELTSRTYFKMMIDGLNYMHNKGVCHRDIKPENLLLNSEFVLKVADFGFSTKLAGPNQDGILKEKLGTEGYMSPQIYTLKYKGDQSDIFAAGVVLFTMYSGHPPFQSATVMDPFFRIIRDKKYPTFWSLHTRKKSGDFYSPQFKNFIEGMLCFNPSQRLTMEQVYQHPWFKDQPTMNFEELRSSFQIRKDKINEVKMNARRLKQQKRSARNDAMNNRGNMDRDSADDATLMFLDNFQKEQIEERKLALRTSITDKDLVIKEDPKIFFSSLFTYLQQKVQLNFDEDNLPFTPSYEINSNTLTIRYLFDYQGTEACVQFDLIVSSTKNNNICLTFKHKSGNDLYFRCLVNKLKEEFIDCEVEEDK